MEVMELTSKGRPRDKRLLVSGQGDKDLEEDHLYWCVGVMFHFATQMFYLYSYSLWLFVDI